MTELKNDFGGRAIRTPLKSDKSEREVELEKEIAVLKGQLRLFQDEEDDQC